MSDLPARDEAVQTQALADPLAIAERARQWLDVASRSAIAGIERAALRCRSGLRASGPLGWSGLGLLFGALIAAWSVLLPQREGLSALRENVASSQQTAGATGAASPRRGAADFLGKLPTRRDVPAILGVILAQAQATQIDLESGSYDWRPGKDGGVGEYRVALPVHGTYPAIRQFIEKTLAAAPAVALDALQLARDDVADGAVDAKVTFVIYLGNSA